MRIIAVTSLLLGLTLAIRQQELYPYGRENQDSRLLGGDDISSDEIFLRSRVPIAFYDEYYDSIYVSIRYVNYNMLMYVEL